MCCELEGRLWWADDVDTAPRPEMPTVDPVTATIYGLLRHLAQGHSALEPPPLLDYLGRLGQAVGAAAPVDEALARNAGWDSVVASFAAESSGAEANLFAKLHERRDVPLAAWLLTGDVPSARSLPAPPERRFADRLPDNCET